MVSLFRVQVFVLFAVFRACFRKKQIAYNRVLLDEVHHQWSRGIFFITMKIVCIKCIVIHFKFFWMWSQKKSCIIRSQFIQTEFIQISCHLCFKMRVYLCCCTHFSLLFHCQYYVVFILDKMAVLVILIQVSVTVGKKLLAKSFGCCFKGIKC